MLSRRVSILFALVLGGCPVVRHSTVDAGPRVDASTAHDVGASPDTSVVQQDTGAPTLDAGRDAFVASAVDAGRDAFVGNDAFVAAPDAGQDAAVVMTTCTTSHMVISEVRTRGTGTNAASDEFVELYNPTSAAIVLDSTFTLTARSTTASTYAMRWSGAGQSVGAHRHFLIVGANYIETPASNASLSSGIADAGSLVLNQGAMVIDAVCFAYDAPSLALIDATYTCEGTPAMSPHDNMTDTNMDASLERRPGGVAGDCTDTNVSANDFATITPATPQNLTSPATP